MRRREFLAAAAAIPVLRGGQGVHTSHRTSETGTVPKCVRPIDDVRGDVFAKGVALVRTASMRLRRASGR